MHIFIRHSVIRLTLYVITEMLPIKNLKEEQQILFCVDNLAFKLKLLPS